MTLITERLYSRILDYYRSIETDGIEYTLGSYDITCSTVFRPKEFITKQSS